MKYRDVFPYAILKERYKDSTQLEILYKDEKLKKYVDESVKKYKHIAFATYLERKLVTALNTLDMIAIVDIEYAKSRSEIINMCKDLLHHIKSINGYGHEYRYEVNQRQFIKTEIETLANHLVALGVL